MKQIAGDRSSEFSETPPEKSRAQATFRTFALAAVAILAAFVLSVSDPNECSARKDIHLQTEEEMLEEAGRGRIEQLTEQINANPNSPKAFALYRKRGDYHRDMYKEDKAIADYTKALQLKPDDAYTLEKRSRVYNFMKKPDLAMKDYTALLKLNPRNEEAILGSAVLKQAAGKNEEAFKLFSQLIAINPNKEVGWSYRALLSRKMGKYQQAISDYCEMIKRNGENDVAYFGRADTYIKLGKYQDALNDYSHLLSISKTAEMLVIRADLYQKMGKFDKAYADYTQAIEIEPTTGPASRAFAGRATVAAKLGKKAQAESDRVQSQKLQEKLLLLK